LNAPEIFSTDMTDEPDMMSEQRTSSYEGFSTEDEASRRNLRRIGRRTQFAAGLVSVLLLLGFATVYLVKEHAAHQLAVTTAADAAAPPPVDVATATPASTTSLLTLPGETAPWYGATIYARVDGYVGKWFVDIGDHVTEGQVLAAIDTPEMDAQLDAARAQLHAAMADVQVREAEARFAESTYRRWKDSPKGVVSEQETEDKKAGAESTAAKLAAAQAQVNLAQGEVDRRKAFEKFKQVTAPFAGTITQRQIDIGNLVTAGSSASTTPLYRLVQDDPIRVFVQVPQNTAPAMKVGTAVTVMTSGTQHRDYVGKITRTSDAVDPLARTLRVEVDIPNPDESLVPGLFVEAGFHVETGGAVEIPAAALMFRAKGPQVALLDGTQVHFRDVMIAQDNGTVVALASGVKAGDKVVLNISSQITDGDEVHVNQADGAAVGLQAVSR
jgi:RND family efflux transporter MFP subunit